MQLFHVNGHDLAVSHEVEEVGIEARRAAAVGAAFDEERGLHFREGFLDGPEVEGVLPDRVAEPRGLGEIAGVADQLLHEEPVHNRLDEPLVNFPDTALAHELTEHFLACLIVKVTRSLEGKSQRIAIGAGHNPQKGGQQREFPAEDSRSHSIEGK